MKTYKIENREVTFEEFLRELNTGVYDVQAMEEVENLTFSENLLLDKLRQRREEECFPVVNRGVLWYESLGEERRAELRQWYRAWLDVTLTKTVPDKPAWLY